MEFNEELPVWKNEGIKPTETKINEGWKVGDKPPADWFNWFQNRTWKNIEELRRVAEQLELDIKNIDFSHLETAINDIKEQLNTKVDKVEDKQLSTEDYTTEEKQKLAGIEAGANKYVHPTTHSADMIVENLNKRFVSDTEKANWNNKETPEGAQAKVDAVSQDLDAHKAEKVHQGEIHGFRLSDGKLEYFDGKEYVRVKGDGYPVGNVSNFNAKEDNQKITLTWQDPEDVTITDSNGNVITIAKWKGTKILRKTGSYPANENDGILVVDNGVRNQYQTNGFVDTGLVNDTEYFYMAFPYTVEDVFTVDEKNRVSATPTEQKIYGVVIDESNSNPETSVVYTDDAVGFTPARGNNGNFSWGSWESIIKEEFKIRPCVLKNPSGEVAYYLDYDDFTKKSDGAAANLTGADGDVMIEFGVPLWWKFTRINNKLKIQLSSKPFDGAVKHAFEIENGYNLVPFYPLTLTQIIYVLMFKNLDSQIALGRGCVGASSYSNTGVINNRTFNYGTTSNTANMKFLGMEDYWGNRKWWIDGCFYDNNRNMLIGKGNFNNTGNGYTNYGQATPSDGGGYIDRVQGQNETGFISASISGSATTYYCDYGTVYAGGLPYFGGSRPDGDRAGGFYLYSSAATYSHAYLGGRLFYSQNGKIYIGAYLGVEQNGKLRSISGYESANDKTIGEFRNLARANNN